MMDIILLKMLRCGSEVALEKFIDKYSAYVCVIIRNIAKDALSREDVEETASDVFFALWENAEKIKKVKPWLGTTARNKTKNKLRSAKPKLPIDDDIPANAPGVEEAFIADCEQATVMKAMLSLTPPDNDIFRLHYYESQTTATIAAKLGLTESSVKHRLVRGRKKLKSILESEAFS
jgi:RNA polymerase sigma-70 factor (ECF subfamily)